MYQPSQKILDNYANVLVNFALNSGKGVNKEESVLLQVPECAKPMLVSLRRAVLKANANAMIQYLPDNMSREFYELANDKQLVFYPEKYLMGRLADTDHSIAIIAETDKHELEGIDPKKIMVSQKVYKPYMDARNKKENAGKFTWTLALYATPQMAQEVKLSLKAYWDEIIKACYLEEKYPVARWQRVHAEIERVKQKLNALKVEKVHVRAPKTDLWVKLGADRTWMGGSGRNIPSFEVFISPDWRGTNGHIQFTEKLYRYGNLIENVYLEFKDGLVTKATASKGEKVLKEMIATENADKIGEFSLTDSRLSRITKFMGETLFDENVGGKNGNTHLALGKAYYDSYPGKISAVKKEQWVRMGYNDSVVHTDIVATSNRIVTAYLASGSELVIYKDGKFTV